MAILGCGSVVHQDVQQRNTWSGSELQAAP
jgi:hypothetical protein